MSAGEAFGGGAKGAGFGAKVGSLGGPLGTVIGGGIGALVGGIGGLLSGRSKRRAAELAAQEAAKRARIDTEYSPFVAQKGYKAETEQYTPGGGASALAGGAAGALQGLNVYQGLKKDNAQMDLLKQLSDKATEQDDILELAKAFK